MRHLTLLALLTPFTPAQTTTTLPKGWDTVDGTDTYGTSTNSYFWNGFAVGPANLPARSLYSYDASTFPFDTTQGTYIISKLSLRSDGPRNPGTTTAHKKKMVVILSTSTHHPAQANFNRYDANHGPDRAVVFGAIGAPKDVDFPATQKPTSGPAPFNVLINLDRIFVVPKDTKTLVIEFRSYSATITTGAWDGDTVRYDGANYNGGSYSLINTNHCVNPSIFFTARATTIGSNFGHIWRSAQPPGGKTVLTWLGPRNPTPFPFPGTPCTVHVYPPLLIRSDTSETSGAFAAYIDWGTIPPNPALVGQRIGHQSMFIDPAYPASAGLTRGGESTIGTGYDKTLVPASSIYSQGPDTTRYTAAVDPDNEPHARFLYRRVPVIRVN